MNDTKGTKAGAGDARARLQTAALALFKEQGYDSVTAAQIAAVAGVTERTFFRHFPDKREVVFQGEAVLRDALTAAVADAAPGQPPLAVLFRAFHAVVPLLEGNREVSVPLAEVIAQTPALQEREAAKMVTLGDALAGALERRGTPPLHAALAARTGLGAFVHAVGAWLPDPRPSLGERLTEAEAALRQVLET